MAWILDLDGVVWLADRPIAGSLDAVRSLWTSGERVVFVTNNSTMTVAEYVAKLRGMGLAAGEDDLCTSPQAAATLVTAGERVRVMGGEGIVAAITARGAEPIGDPEDKTAVSAVVVGLDRALSYPRLAAAFAAIRSGARFIATNDDSTYPTPHGLIPGGGAMVAALAYCTGVSPTVAGKPNAPMAALVRERLAGEAITFCVGDRLDTDGAFAKALGAPFALVLSGVTQAADVPLADPRGGDPAAEVVAASLADLVARR